MNFRNYLKNQAKVDIRNRIFSVHFDRIINKLNIKRMQKTVWERAGRVLFKSKYIKLPMALPNQLSREPLYPSKALAILSNNCNCFLKFFLALNIKPNPKVHFSLVKNSNYASTKNLTISRCRNFIFSTNILIIFHLIFNINALRQRRRLSLNTLVHTSTHLRGFS